MIRTSASVPGIARVSLRAICLFGFMWTIAGAGAASEPGRVIPAEVVTAESCGECHASELVVWKKTPHATGFKSLHRKASATAIAERMGIKLIKRDSVCLDCHYTPTEQRGQMRAVSGVSCENCHGSGKNWIDVHNDYGGKGVDHTTESAEHRAARIEASRAAGMRRPTDLYPVVSSCFACHTVPNEELVNVGKHSLGSSGFELVEWMEQIRHNFLDSFLTGDGSVNAELTQAHKRRMYFVGRALDLEYSLRGLAEATESGVFFKAMQRRLRSSVVEVRSVAAVSDLDTAEQMLTLAKNVKAKLGNRNALLAAADRVGALTQQFLAEFDETSAAGQALASLDPLIAGEQIDLPVDPEPEPQDSRTVVAAGGTQSVSSGTVSTAGGVASAPGQSGVQIIPAIEAEGEKRSHLRPRSQFDTLAASACQKCHGDQNAWWFDDPHYAAVEPFLDRARKPSKIARLYGLSPNQMARGDSICMDCHGTIATARAKREVQDGVSCQSCHGPGASYLDPHQEGDKSLGRQRPGFQKALQLGMKDLKDLKIRMRNCASCHYVTDPRLISSGHPTGVDFDIVDGMAQVKHWSGNIETSSSLKAAYQAVLSERGAIPKVRLARLEQRISPSGEPVVEPSAAPRLPTVRAPRPVARRAGGARGAGAGAGSVGSGATAIDLPELPEVSEGTSIEDLLKLVKERVELLYEKLGGARVHGGQQGDGS